MSPLRRRPDGTYRGDRLGHRDQRGRGAAGSGARHLRRRGDRLLRRRWAGQPPRRRLRRRRRWVRSASRFKANAVSQEKTGEMLVMGKMFGAPLRGDFEHCEVAFFVGKNPWISHGIPRARTTLKAIAGRSRPGDDRDRSAGHRDRRAGRFPPAGAAGARRLAGRRRWRRCSSTRASSTAPGWLATRSGYDAVLAALGDVPIGRYCEISGGRRGAGAGGDPADRGGVERGRVRGPRRADEPPLDAGQLPGEAGVVADRQPRHPRRAVRDDRHGRHLAHGPQRAAPHRRPGLAGRRAQGDRRADPVQRDRRGDPRRSPEAVSGDDRRVGQPGALGRRQPADARGDARPRRQRRASTCS